MINSPSCDNIMNDKTELESAVEIAQQVRTGLLDVLKSEYVGKDEVIDLLGICLVAGENLFLLGPPGTAKSAVVRSLASRLDGRVFDYLLTRFTEPSELFGPFDIRRLREGDLLTNTEGMLPEADVVFLDELLNANSAILNSLLMALIIPVRPWALQRQPDQQPYPQRDAIDHEGQKPDPLDQAHQYGNRSQGRDEGEAGDDQAVMQVGAGAGFAD